MGILIVSAISSILLLFTDFGGYYTGSTVYIYLFGDPISTLLIGLISLPILYCTFVGYKGYTATTTVGQKEVVQGYSASHGHGYNTHLNFDLCGHW